MNSASVSANLLLKRTTAAAVVVVVVVAAAVVVVVAAAVVVVAVVAAAGEGGRSGPALVWRRSLTLKKMYHLLQIKWCVYVGYCFHLCMLFCCQASCV